MYRYNDNDFRSNITNGGSMKSFTATKEQEELAKSMAEELGVKLGDFMMPIRMAVTGSRISPPLMGSILILGKDKALERTDRTIATFN